MQAVEIKKDIYWVGAVDWNIRNFHGYQTNRGTSYNSYLIMDEKKVLIDTVKESKIEDMLERIKSIIDPSELDIIISNHIELDHSGGLPILSQLAPNVKIITSTKGKQGLSHYYDTSKWNIEEVASGSSINIGSRNIQFVHTPMLHWPDSMVSYIPQDQLLLSNDAFGQHLSLSYLFDDQNPRDIVFEEAEKYYANILLPFAPQVKRALKALSELKINMIAPSHGIIWRERIPEIIDKYKTWSNSQNREKAVIIYDSMWNATEKMANEIKSSFEARGIPTIIRSLKTSHISEIMGDILEAKYIAIGSPVLNNQILPTVAAMLCYLKGLKPKNKIGFAFGSYGWNHVAINEIENTMAELKWDIPIQAINIKYRPNRENLAILRENIDSALKEINND